MLNYSVEREADTWLVIQENPGLERKPIFRYPDEWAAREVMETLWALRDLEMDPLVDRYAQQS